MTTETRTASKKDIHRFTEHAPAVRPPLRTIPEFAAEIGVSTQSLKNLLRAGGAPAVSLRLGTRKNYYIHSELRAWWKLQVQP